MTAAMCPAPATIHATPKPDPAPPTESAAALSPRMTELLDWLNREWDDRLALAESANAAASLG